ncbi:NTPase KAP family P-loop domain-containing protein 1 isoform X2 [Alligator mississippiensis]|uniref:NTPase KAP family P-loop domain-containing protein 1 isoform X2 n=1 Tax=Alligator mississippiensis TaxID=8496 RepID=UPI00287741EB|nr:NTPase KAP family P-loop domain-containing protein 1 isoform X2 [Alligator mississippiensis]
MQPTSAPAQTALSKAAAYLGNPASAPAAPAIMHSSSEEAAYLNHPEEPLSPGSLYSRGETYAIDLEDGKDALTEDDVYCRCLSKTLCYTSTPVTVGFYAPCGQRLHSMLDKITACMNEESARREQEELRKSNQKPRSAHGWGLIVLLWYLIFYRPVITEYNLRRKNLRSIFIRFSAWQYAGSDKLWAGLITTLCGSIRSHFGALPLSFYQVVGTRPQFASGFSQKEWYLKGQTCMKLWGLLFFLVSGISLFSVAAFVPGIRESKVLKVAGGSFATLSGSGAVLTAFNVIKNIVVTQKHRIEKLTDSNKFSSHLGFMSKVKREIESLTGFMNFMEIYERRRLRIVMEITCLDTCCPERITGVLNAMNTLLSDTNAPFIFILVVDPSVIVPCLEQTSCMKGIADNGYLFLNRTVTLPFSVPFMGIKSKLQCLHSVVQTREDLMYQIITRNVEREVKKVRWRVEMVESAEPAGETDLSQLDAQAVRYIHEAFHCVHDDSDCLHRYIPDSITQMRRIVNTVPITLRLMMHRSITRHTIAPRAVAAWVVLANQWPCRLSWVLQCVEDKEQLQPTEDFRHQTLWSVFTEHCAELYAMHKDIKNILDLDADPELFQKFLSGDFPFTVQEADTFLRNTVNLDHSIKHKLALIRALNTLAVAAKEPTLARASSVSRGVQCSATPLQQARDSTQPPDAAQQP